MSEARVYTKPFVLTTLAFFCFFMNVNAYNLLPLYLQALGARTGAAFVRLTAGIFPRSQ